MFAETKISFIFAPRLAGVAELVDALDLGSSAKRRGGSSPFVRTSYLAAMLENVSSRRFLLIYDAWFYPCI